MKFRLPVFLFLIFISAAFAGAQSVYTPPNACLQPFSDKFDEFNFTNIADARERLRKFEEFVNETGEARGFIHVYGGKKSRINEIAEIMAEIKKVLKIGDSNYTPKLDINEEGYRDLPTVDLIVKPLDCSEYPSGSGLQIDEVEFAEVPAASTVKKSPDEINNSLVKKTEPVCPPAARAVRACDNKVEVYVIIDRKGDVIFSKSVSGHPLLRASGANAVKNWKFQPAKIKDKTYNVTGYISVEFRQPDDNY